LNDWVIRRLKPVLKDLRNGFYDKAITYYLEPGSFQKEKHFLRAAHYLATSWEFDIIYGLNRGGYDIEDINNNIQYEAEEYFDLLSFQKIYHKKKIYAFINLCGQLRFQNRWAQTPRIPKTTVLGHLMMVALLTYFTSNELSVSNRRLYNNFFGALFHDLPEVLTRDIISPVKKGVPGFNRVIKEYEERAFEERVLPLLPDKWEEEIRYLIMPKIKGHQGDEPEFVNRIIDSGTVKQVTFEEIEESYSSDTYYPLDGNLIRACDDLAAFTEVVYSTSCGITSKHLEHAEDTLLNKYEGAIISGINFDELFSSVIDTFD